MTEQNSNALDQNSVGKESATNKMQNGNQNLKSKRYCNGKLKRGQFICMNACIALVVLICVLLPLLHQIIIPNYIQKTVDNFGKVKREGSYTKISKAAITELNPNEMHLNLNVQVSPFSSFGLQVGLEPFSIQLLNVDSKDIVLGTLDVIDPIKLQLNKEIDIKLNAKIVLDSDHQAHSQDLIKKLSTETVDELNLRVNFAPGIKVFGWTLYKSLPLHRDIKLAPPSVSSIINSDGTEPAKGGENESLLTWKPIDNSNLQSNFKNDEISILESGWGVTWKNLHIPVNDNSLSFELDLAFENISPFWIVEIGALEFYATIENAKVAKISFKNLGLKEGFNSNFFIGLTITFIDDLITPDRVREVIELASSNFANGDFTFGIAGPIKAAGGDWIENITNDMSLGIKWSDVKSTTSSSSDSSYLDLNNSDFSFSVLSDRITADVGLNLPSLKNIKPPAKVEFPYESKISFYGEGQKVVDLQVDPLNVDRSNSGISLKTGVTILPVNNDLAATALANTVNPVLDGLNTSKLGIRDFAFSLPGQNSFKWCDVIFADRIIDYTLPAFENTLFESSTSEDNSKSLYDGTINVKQLNDKPGFGATGDLKIDYPSDGANLQIDIGYFHFDSYVESTPMLAMELPTGLKFSSSTPALNLNAAVVFSKDSALPSKLNRFIRAYQGVDEYPTSFSASNLRFGISEQQHIVTFSKISLGVSGEQLKSKLNSGQNNSDSPRTESIAKIHSASLEVKSATDVNLGISLNLKNPLEKVTISIGSVGISALIDGGNLLDMNFSPVNLGLGDQKMDLTVGMKLSNGADGMNSKVADIFEAFMKDKFDNRNILDITGLAISSPSGDANGLIDQFSEFPVLSKTVGRFLEESKNNKGSRGVSIVDTSVFDTSDLDLSSSYNFSNSRITAKPQASLLIETEISYGNQLPLSIKIPYFGIDSFLIRESSVMALTVSGLDIVSAGNGLMKPNSVVSFKKDKELKKLVGDLYGEYDRKKLTSSVGIQGLLFGTPGNVNRLLDQVKWDISENVKGIFEKESLTSEENDTTIFPSDFDKYFELDAEFRKSKEVIAKAKVPFNGPLSVSVDIPMLKIGSFINNSAAFDLTLDNFKTTFTEGQKQVLELSLAVKVNDTPELAGNLAAVFAMAQRQTPIPGSVGGGSLVFGVSEEDYVDLFSLISITKNLEDLIGEKLRDIFNDSQNSTPSENTKSISFDVEKLDISAKEKQKLVTKIDSRVGIEKQIRIRGLNFVRTSLGLNGKPVMEVQSPLLGGGELNFGSNNLAVDVVSTFSNSQESKDAINFFAKESIDNLGNQKTLFTASGTLFGYDSENYFRFLSRTAFLYRAKKIVNQELVDKIKSKIKSGDQHSEKTNKKVEFTDISLEFTENKTILANVNGSLSIPDWIRLDLPYFRFGTKISTNDTHSRFFDVEMKDIHLSGDISKIQLGSVISIHDTEDLSNIAAQIIAQYGKDPLPANLDLGASMLNSKGEFTGKAESYSEEDILQVNFVRPDSEHLAKRTVDDIQGTLGGGYFAFGIDNSSENVVSIFDQVSLDLDFQEFLKLLPEDTKKNTSDFSETIDSLELELTNFYGATMEGRTVSTNFQAKFKSPYVLNASLKGMGFVAGAIGIAGPSGIAQVVQFGSNGIGISPGLNSLDVKSKLVFPKSPHVAKIVGNFANSLSSSLGNTREKLFVSGFRFGPSPEKSFAFLSKAKIGVASSKIINEDTVKMLKNKFDGAKFSEADKFLLKKLHLDTDPKGSIILDGAAFLANQTLDAQGKVGYLCATAIIDNNRMVTTTFATGIDLITDGEKNVNLATKIILDFQNEPIVQNSITTLGRAILTNSTEIDTQLGVAGILFGSDDQLNNIIDTFSEVKISQKVAEYIPWIREKYDDIKREIGDIIVGEKKINTTSDIAVELKNVDLEVVGNNLLMAEVEATYSGLMYDINIQLPYLRSFLDWNNKKFLTNIITNLKLGDGKLTTTVMVQFEENKEAASDIFQIVGNLLFHRKIPSNSSIAPSAFAFGSSDKAAVSTFQKLKVEFGLGSVIERAINYVDRERPFEIDDIQAILVEEGIFSQVKLSFGSNFLHLKSAVNAGVYYQDNGEGPVEQLVEVPITALALPNVSLLMQPVLKNAATAKVIAMAADKLISFEDFASNARLGYLTVTGRDGSKLSVFDQAYFNVGEIILWSPITVDILLIDPGEPDSDGIYQLPIEIFLSWRNGGPFHLDLGHLNVLIKEAGKPIITVLSRDDLVILNKNEGAENPVLMGRIRAILPVNELTIEAIQATIEKLLNSKDLEVNFALERKNAPISYVSEIIEQLEGLDVIGVLSPLLGVLLANLDVEIIDELPPGVPAWEKIFSQVSAWTTENLPGVKTRSLDVANHFKKVNATSITTPFMQRQAVTIMESANIRVIAH